MTNIEDSKTIHELDLKEEVSFLSWNKYTNLDGVSGTKQEVQEVREILFYTIILYYTTTILLQYTILLHYTILLY